MDNAETREARFTSASIMAAIFEHGTEIADGLMECCQEAVRQERSWTIVSNGDLMFLIDAYREALAHLDGSNE